MDMSFSIFGIFFVIVAVMMLVGTLFHFGVMAMIFKRAYDASQSAKSMPGTHERSSENASSPATVSDPRCPSCGATDPEPTGGPVSSGDVRCRYCGSRFNLFRRT